MSLVTLDSMTTEQYPTSGMVHLFWFEITFFQLQEMLNDHAREPKEGIRVQLSFDEKTTVMTTIPPHLV
ncbi:hypothetical protein Hanom_Chr17g01574921 [Helianthus anomalus]